MSTFAFKRKKLLWQLFPPFVLLVIVSLLVGEYLSAKTMRRFFMQQMHNDLLHQATLLREAFAPLIGHPDAQLLDRQCKAQGLNVPSRITVVQADGRVIGDSQSRPDEMENHADRPEIRTALAGETGTDLRLSHTLHHPMYYLALPVRVDTRVAGALRVAIATRAIDDQMNAIQRRLMLEVIAVALLASLVCLAISRRLSRPIETMCRGAARYAQGDLTHRIAAPVTTELAELAEAMNHMAAELQGRIDTIVRQHNESEAVLSSMAEGVIAVDMEERVIHLNRVAAEMLGQTAEKTSHRALHEIVRNRELHAIARRTLETGLATEGDVELHQPAKQILCTRAAPLKDSVGRRIGVLLVVDDVTRLRRLENMRRDFTANVSHEIKTPLTTIYGFVETLYQEEVDDPAEKRRFLGIIKKHVSRLTDLIDDLLKLAQLEQEEAGAQLKLEPTTVREVIDSAVQFCAEKAGQKKIEVEVDCAKEIAARLDADLMSQAFINLIDNAVKYSSAGSRITITARRLDENLCISFRDRGIGIAKEHLPRLFERFYRVDAARSREMGGTGLGLAIVKHIAQAHGGGVAVESMLGAGSTFHIDLPALS
jgi:two-component system phosphate regulon sensor histidine kinase PhoR